MNIYSRIPLNIKPPNKAEATASNFADWVYEQTHIEYKSNIPKHQKEERLKQGKITHELIDFFFKFRWAHEELKPGEASDWDIIFSEEDGNNSNYFLASSLKVNNQSLRCKPDVVLKHKSLDKILIIERKTTRMSDKFVPKDGWANLATQLWCYGWIDEWLDCEDVTLVGQIWQRTWANSLTMLQSHPFYQRNDIRYHDACLNWFQKYGGEFVRPPQES